MVAFSSASVVPAIEQWGMLVTNLSATVATVLRALCVLILFSPSNRCPPFEFLPTPRGFNVAPIQYLHCGASMKHPEYNAVLMTSKSIATEPYEQRSVSGKSYVLTLTLGIPQLSMYE